jgi:hypothetical protein
MAGQIDLSACSSGEFHNFLVFLDLAASGLNPMYVLQRSMSKPAMDSIWD